MKKYYLIGAMMMLCVGLFGKDSALSKGTWYKLKVINNGIYKLTSNDLKNIGIDTKSIDPRKVRIHGSGGRILPENLDDFRYEDVVENSIYVSGEADGKFDDGDYVLFYGHGVEYSQYDKKGNLVHAVNPYSTESYYFLTIGDYNGKRVEKCEAVLTSSNATINQFKDIYFHEKELINIGGTGREWWGEAFDSNTEMSFNVTLSGVDLSKDVVLNSQVASNAKNSSSFDVYVDGKAVMTQSLMSTGTSSYYSNNSLTAKIKVTAPNISLKYKYKKLNNSNKGWLGYFSFVYTRNMYFEGGNLNFKVPTLGDNSVNEYIISGANSGMRVWDISDYANPVEVKGSLGNNSYRFKGVNSLPIHEYYAFDESSVMTPTYVGKVANQNIHGNETVNYIIVAYPDFKAEAQRLADYHRNNNGLSVLVTTTEEVYNEFSSGSQDITAIRDLGKMMYDRSPGALKFLLLFGDCSYDYQNRVHNNTNYVPTYEAIENSQHQNSSIQTDDYFGVLENGSNDWKNKGVDIAVGRFPVTTIAQAQNAVDKTINYMQNKKSSIGSWRNIVTLISDDGERTDAGFFDNTGFMLNCEELDNIIKLVAPEINTEKIYLDNYEQVATPGSHRYPDATAAIAKRVNEGSLIMTYVGHAGDLGLAKEQVVGNTDVQGWDNFDNIPILTTASCEFTRCDNPDRISTGKWAFLNPKGGAFLISATRPTYDSPNMALFKNFYQYLFSPDSDGTIGYAYQKAKKKTVNTINYAENTAKYLLICDPALVIARPKHNIKITELNGVAIDGGVALDSIKAFSKVMMKGIITDDSGSKLSWFNGIVTPTVFDKEKMTQNRGNDGIDIITFPMRNSVIFRGDVLVENGEFEFEFIAPKDIDYTYGFGKVSLYAGSEADENGVCIDATGYNERIVVGGIDKNVVMDTTPPKIVSFLNDEKFYNGITVNDKPIFMAKIKDESGVNTVGNGIGHDIVLDIMGIDYSSKLVINNYYKSDFGTYKSGNIEFRMPQLSDGYYEVTLTVWDVFNNSAKSTIFFTVRNSEKCIIENLCNYPNPFRDLTHFKFEHNQPNKNMTGEIIIYDMAGRLVKKLNKNINDAGFVSDVISWDRSIDGGGYAEFGVYIYNLNLYDETKQLKGTKKGKLMVGKN